MGRAIVTALGFRPPSGHSMVHSEEELKMLVTASQEAGVLEEQEEQMLHRVFGFGDLTAGQVMLPRTEMTAVPVEADLERVTQAFLYSGQHHLPVFRGTLDDTIGFAAARDVLALARDASKKFNIVAAVHDALTVPETMPADDLLAEMQRRRVQEAIVIDEYGGTAGLVTFDRLMERIVGDLGYGPGQGGDRVTLLADGSALVDGLGLVRDLNERFGLHIDEQTYNTLGGYILGRLGRRARIGDEVDVDGRTLRVEALDGLRVARVFMSRERDEGARR
jgi:CBS domain containing-hemolysin-like protein